MVEALSIKRRKPGDSELGFDSLRRDAIALAQQYSGQRWSDYNLHDPGVTILEQLIYAITDLAYRSEFPIEDYLAGEDGSLDLEALALHAPAEVFPCRPVTRLDYRKLLLNALPEADNLWIAAIPAEEEGNDHNGLYRLSVKFVQGLDPQQRAEAKGRLRAAYLGLRNLCEDLGEIRVVDNIEYELHARIEVDSARQPADILAEIYFKCARCIASGATITRYDQLADRTPPLDQLFDGPYTDHGFFMDEDMRRQPAGFPVSTLYSIINSVEAVDQIEELYLARDNRRYYDSVDPPGADKAFDLHFPRHAEAGVVLTINDRVLPISMDEVAARYDEYNFKYQISRSTRQDLSLLYEPIRGTRRPLEQYFSIQNQFPAIYGINQMGVPASAPDETMARARQLKAYLVIFEQLLSNFQGNLGNLRALFSTQIEPQNSYAAQALDAAQINDLDAVYPCNAGEVILRIVAGSDNFNERKSRLLDYLLALYGEKFSQHALRHFNYYYGRDEIDALIIANKVAYLESVVELARDRAAAVDYSAATDLRGHSGLQRRVALLLGFEQHQGNSLSGAIAEQGIELYGPGDHEQRESVGDPYRLVQRETLDDASRDSFEQPPLRRPDAKLSPGHLRDRISDIIAPDHCELNDRLLHHGIDIARYRIGQLKSSPDCQLLFQIDEGKDEYWHLASYADKPAAVEAANYLRQFLILLNKASEGLYLIEHILLRPQGESQDEISGMDSAQDFYSFRVSVIFPAWTSRCQNKQFRMLAEETLQLNLPAHVHADTYWLDLASMIEFESRYEQWLILKRDLPPEASELDRCAGALITFLLELRDAPPAQT